MGQTNNIKLECGCGAKLELSNSWDTTVQKIYAEWQKEHSAHFNNPTTRIEVNPSSHTYDPNEYQGDTIPKGI